MSKTIFLIVMFSIVVMNTMQASNEDVEIDSQNPEIVLLNSNDETGQFKTGETLTFKFVSSLNFAGKKKIKKQALDKFMAFASSKGYTHIQIDEEASNKKQHEMRKRNYTVVFIGTAYK